MSLERDSNGNADDAIALAEEYIERHREDLRSNFGSVYEQEIERWKQRKSELSEADPLYEVAEARIAENREKLEQLESQTDAIRGDLLTIVCENFVAKSEWLNPTLFRALNLIFFDKYSDTLVVDRTVLDDASTLEDEELFAVSRKVRELARTKCEEH